MATNYWKVNVVKTATSSTYMWQFTNTNTNEVKNIPVSVTQLDMTVQSTTDYTFIWNKNKLNEFQLNVIQIKYIGSGTNPPAGNNSTTDFNSIIALI
jgi:hypothetical protein